MKRLVLVLVPLALVFSACAVPVIKPPTYLSDKGAVFNGDVYSNVNGNAEYWWSISFANGGGGTSHHTVPLVAGQPGAVSTPFTILDPSTTYHLTMCAQDAQESPPRPVCSKPTDFTTPPAGGRSGFAYETGSEIWAADTDGSNATRLTNNSFSEGFPAWSPDGKKIVFTSGRDNPGRSAEIYTMNADGSNQTRLTFDSTKVTTNPSWSPDGSKIAWIWGNAGNYAIWVMNPDGSNKTKLTGDNDAVDLYAPAWSPDGAKIAFVTKRGGNPQIYVMNADGSNQTNISRNSSVSDIQPSWSPDGSKVAFSRSNHIWTMNAGDGSGQTQLTSAGLVDDISPQAWSPTGSRIIFDKARSPTRDGWAMNADGSSQGLLLTNLEEIAWSPRP